MERAISGVRRLDCLRGERALIPPLSFGGAGLAGRGSSDSSRISSTGQQCRNQDQDVERFWGHWCDPTRSQIWGRGLISTASLQKVRCALAETAHSRTRTGKRETEESVVCSHPSAADLILHSSPTRTPRMPAGFGSSHLTLTHPPTPSHSPRQTQPPSLAAQKSST